MNEAIITETYFMKCSDGIRLSIGMDGEDFTCCCSIVMKDNEVENQLSSLFYTIGVPNMESCVGKSVSSPMDGEVFRMLSDTQQRMCGLPWLAMIRAIAQVKTPPKSIRIWTL